MQSDNLHATQAEDRRVDDFQEACGRALDLLAEHAARIPNTPQKRMHAKNKIDAAIARANRIGKPLGLTFEETIRRTHARVKGHQIAARLVVGTIAACVVLGLIAWVVWLVSRG